MTVAHACDPYHKYMGSHSLQAEPKCTPTEGYKEQTVEGEEDPKQRRRGTGLGSSQTWTQCHPTASWLCSPRKGTYLSEPRSVVSKEI